MKYQFRTDVETRVPTCALIENYQDLNRAIKNGDWDLVQVAADCLADTIQDYTTVPDDLKIKPSGSSLVAMSCESGVIVGEDGEDIQCVAGIPVSETLCGGCLQCNETCQYRNDCCPETGTIRIGKGDFDIFNPSLAGQSLVTLDKLEKRAE